MYDPEYVDYACFDRTQVDGLLDKTVAELISALMLINLQQLKPSLAKLLLHFNEWDIERVKRGYKTDPRHFLIEVYSFSFIFYDFFLFRITLSLITRNITKISF